MINKGLTKGRDQTSRLDRTKITCCNEPGIE